MNFTGAPYYSQGFGSVPVTTKINLPVGTNATVGQTTALVAGTITVFTSQVDANSLIYLTNAGPGGTSGTLSVGTIVPGVSFVINSSSGLDTSKVNWLIIN